MEIFYVATSYHYIGTADNKSLKSHLLRLIVALNLGPIEPLTKKPLNYATPQLDLKCSAIQPQKIQGLFYEL